jgi:hypothetical protein
VCGEAGLHPEALCAAARATHNYLTEFGEGYPCGFAWVHFSPARGKFFKYLKKRFSYRHISPGFTIWNPSGSSTQNMEAKFEGARAFVEVIRKYNVDKKLGNFEVQYYCRLD